MNTMIPNQVRLSLDLDDLPTRSIQVSSEELALTGGQRRRCENVGGRPIFSNRQAPSICNPTCRRIGTRWNGQWVTVARGRASVCSCCRR